MKSNRIVTFFKHSAAPLAVCLFAGIISAQFRSVAEGSFSLSSEVRWGEVVLPAGQYSFVLHSEELPAILSVKRDRRTVALVIAESHNELKGSKDNSLILVRQGDKRSIQMLRLGCIGRVYSYTVPKGEKPSQMAQAPQLLQRIPVTVAGE